MISTNDRLSLAFQCLTCESLKLRRNVLKEKISAESFFRLTIAELKCLGASKELFPRFFDPIALADQQISRANDHGIKIVYSHSPSFPQRLHDIFDPPLCVFVLGDEAVLHQRTLGVVGSRRHSQYGIRIMKKYFTALINAQIVIVSGMAYGIDTAAHNMALEHQGKTIGVNAGGLLHFYPAGNHQLFKHILSSGCIVSEFPVDTVPRPYHFPIRNRIIAGLSEKIWIVEAAERSGSLITARLALENGRDVLATPGPVDAPTSEGANRLIRDGAKPVLGVKDILEEFGLEIEKKIPTESSPICDEDEKLLLDILKENGVKDIDFLVEKAALPVNIVLSALNGLLIRGIVNLNPGGLWNINE